MYPSVKTLTAAFGRDKAIRIRAIMEGPVRDGNDATRMERINEVLETHGVERIDRGHNAKSPSILYCNQGDPYSTTVMKINDRFVVGDWGYYVERGKYD